MGCKIKVLNSKGQTAVEYIMLLAVSAFLVSAVYNSDTFDDYFGEGGTFAKAMQREISTMYQYGIRTDKRYRDNYRSPNHSNYKGSETTRFFGAKDPYPGDQ
jgi:hypothetical protein